MKEGGKKKNTRSMEEAQDQSRAKRYVLITFQASRSAASGGWFLFFFGFFLIEMIQVEQLRLLNKSTYKS